MDLNESCYESTDDTTVHEPHWWQQHVADLKAEGKEFGEMGGIRGQHQDVHEREV